MQSQYFLLNSLNFLFTCLIRSLHIRNLKKTVFTPLMCMHAPIMCTSQTVRTMNKESTSSKALKVPILLATKIMSTWFIFRHATHSRKKCPTEVNFSRREVTMETVASTGSTISICIIITHTTTFEDFNSRMDSRLGDKTQCRYTIKRPQTDTAS